MGQCRTIAAATLLLALAGHAAAQPTSSVPGLWTLDFSDEFDGAALDTNKWAAFDGCSGSGSSAICREAGNVSVGGGVLSIATSSSSDPASTYATGRIDSLASFGSGYIETRFRATAASGINNAVFATQGVSFGPPVVRLLDGSDFNAWQAETGFSDFIPPTTSGSVGDQYLAQFGIADPFPSTLDLSADFVTYGLQWTQANEFIWTADGVEVDRYQVPDSAEFTSMIRWAIGTAINDANDFGVVDPATAPGSSMDVEYIRYYVQDDLYFGADPFGYAGGSLAGADGGFGFTAPWTVESGAIDVAADNQSITIPAALPGLPATTGGRLVSGGGDVVRDLDASQDIAASSGQDKFFAALLRKDDAAEVSFGFERSDGISRWGLGVNADEAPAATVFAQGVGDPGAAPVNETFLIVGWFDSETSDVEVARTKIFRVGDLIPTDPGAVAWDASSSTNSTVTMSRLRINVVGGQAEIDEIRLGDTLASVLDPAGAPGMTEPFGYPAGPLAGGTGGTGWDGAWALVGGAVDVDAAGSLSNIDSPSFDPRTGTGSRLVVENGSAVRPFSDPAVAASFPMNLQNNDTYFVSFLAEQSSGSALDVQFEDENGNVRWTVGLNEGLEVSGGVTSDQTARLAGRPTPTAAGNRLDLTGDSDMERRLVNSIPLSATGETWFSAVVEKSDSATLGFFFLDNSGNIRWLMNCEADESIRADTFGPDTVVADLVPVDETFVFLAQLERGAAETIRIKILRAGDPVPVSGDDIQWDLVDDGSTGATLTRLVIETTGGRGQLDELRIGGSFEDVLTDAGSPDVVESFDYPAGALAGANGGTGWDGAWSLFALSDWTVASPGFAYPSLALGGATGEPVFVVARFQARASGSLDDEVRVKVFGQGEAVPENSNAFDWDLIVPGQSSGVLLEKVRVAVSGTPGSSTQFDELAMGTTLASVTAPVPDDSCGPDLAAPFGALDVFDVLEYLQLLGAGDPAADLAAPFGTLDVSDVNEFLNRFNAGC